MDRNITIDAIGRERFEAACADEWQIASSPHYGEGNFPAISQLGHDVADEIVDIVWRPSLAPSARLEQFLLFYESLPSYWFLVAGVFHHLDYIPRADRARFWSWTRLQLASDEPALRQPLAYFLWCEIFESSHWVEEGWTNLVNPLPAARTLQTLLINSGPVPFGLKKPVYEQLIGDPNWHYYIYRSILHSAFDYCGQIDLTEGLQILSRLSLDDTAEHLPKLTAKLQG
jgi:hypothetical protein